MIKINKIKNINIEKLLMIFLCIQPILDLLTSLTIRFTNISLTIGVVVRTLIMALVTIYVVLKKSNSKFKKITLGFYALFSIYILLFLTNSINNKGIYCLFSEIKGIVKTFYLPIMLVSYINIYINTNEKIENKLLDRLFLVYSIMIFIPTSLGIYCYSYNNVYNGLGSVGLFYSANEVGAILGILLIYTLNKFIYNKLTAQNLISIELLLFSVLYLGTKVPALSLILTIIYFIFINILRVFLDSKNKKEYFNIIKKIIILVLCIIPLSLNTPVIKNFTSLNDKFNKIKDSVNINEETEEVSVEKKDSVKEKLEKYTSTMTSGRKVLLKNAKVRFNNSSKFTKLLGYGYVERSDNSLKTIKTVEMDYYDIIFAQGIIGSILFFVPILYLAINSIIIVFKNFKNIIMSEEYVLDIFSIVLGLCISFVSGHVLSAPAVNIYLIVIITKFYKKIKAI